MRMNIYIVFGFFLNLVNFSKSASEAPIVSTCSGDVRGVWMKTEDGRTIEAYLGIPYAKPPHRFEDPELFEKWEGEIDGSKEATKCLQMSIFEPGVVDGSEDCLQMNIYTPSSTEKSIYPVLFYIYGGSFLNGYANTDFYGPSKLLSKDVILIVINYRMGFLGFASYNDKHFSGNYGLKDQSIALKWVKQHIAYFGGDETRITVFGQSSGAASAHYQVLSPQNKGIIRQAILMSGTVDCPWAFCTRFKSADLTAKMAKLVNCHQISAVELKKCLSKVNASEFVLNYEKFQEIWPDVPSVIFPPCLESNDNENAFITEESYNKRTACTPLMIGSTSSEGTLNIATLMQATGDKFEEKLSELDREFTKIIPVQGGFQDDPDGKNKAARWKKIYFGDSPISSNNLRQLADLYSDIDYLNGIKCTIEKQRGKQYLYKFGYESLLSITQVLSNDPHFKMGVSHGDDLLYLFPMKLFGFQGKESAKDREMSRKMVDLVVKFAINGDPNPVADTTRWYPNSGQRDYLWINPEGNFQMKDNFTTNKATSDVHCCKRCC
uniref:Carboxylic ester hydrolase n=1 Tax=Sogatella furcifera TaxID=113103 RepID=A0A2S1TP72_SOGFU|nr:carboxylesterase [Sogatella furcifera]